MKITAQTTDTEIIRGNTVDGVTNFKAVRSDKIHRDRLQKSLHLTSSVADRPLAVKALEMVRAAMEEAAAKSRLVARLQAGKKRKKVERQVAHYFDMIKGVA